MYAQKYHNRFTEVDGIRFHSMAEAKFYQTLKIMMKASELKERVIKIELQPSFLLQDKFVANTGEKIRAIKYVSDFKVTYGDNTEIVYDVKGMRTEVYKLKRKMFLFKYPHINFQEV